MYPIRINKYLTAANYCSRRQADRLIEEGKVYINDNPAKLGDKVNKGDEVYAEGQLVKLKIAKEKVYIAFNKPVGVICTTDANAKDNIIDYLHFPTRVYPIGRLDVASSGLILLTNDGAIVNKILKAESLMEKEYIVEVDQDLTRAMISELQHGVQLDDMKTQPCKVKQLSDKRFAIVLTEGKNRQIRRMVEHFGYKVVRLSRIRIGNISLNNMKVGSHIIIPADQIYKQLGIK